MDITYLPKDIFTVTLEDGELKIKVSLACDISVARDILIERSPREVAEIVALAFSERLKDELDTYLVPELGEAVAAAFAAGDN